ncbi:YihY/virulence factor BrkB family protein [Kineococcus gynurae]|uniref:YihY/virulence factor BrkB family protein n=1 Tax=Kineococcus gynurae TaxID=452979 RepID=A0ABV5LQZ1_9ACTN
MSVISATDAFQRRHRGVSYPLSVLYKFFDDQGGYLAALITYYAFVSLFPLLLLMSTVLGYVLADDPRAQDAVISSALGQFPVIGTQLEEPERLGGGALGIVIGSLGALYGALGVGLALQNAVNIAWAIPRNERPNPIQARLRSLLLIVTAGLFVLGTTILSAISADVGRWLGATGTWETVLNGLSRAAAAVFTALAFSVAFRLAAAHRPRFAQVVPGGIFAAVIWLLLQNFGGNLVDEVMRRASDTNFIFALVLGLLAFLYVASVAVVLAVEGDVVRVNRLYPRALLTPLTDAVELTEADERAYAGQAKAARLKGFELVRVTFDKRLAEGEGLDPGSASHPDHQDPPPPAAATPR